MSDEEFQELVRHKLRGMMQNDGNRQRVIRIDEVEKFIFEGWDFVAAIPGDTAIMRTPL